MTIHREGHLILLLVAAVLVIFNILVHQLGPPPPPWPVLMATSSVVFFLFVLQFFRNPKVVTLQDNHKVYAPADGKVVVIEETYEQEYFSASRKQVSIFMSPVNAHVNRSPISGTIKKYIYHPGKYLVAWHPKSSVENERTTLVVEDSRGVDILVRQIAGVVARRIKCYVGEGDLVTQGEEFGFIKFGSRVDVFLPMNAQIKIEVGKKTRAGKTVIAQLP